MVRLAWLVLLLSLPAFAQADAGKRPRVAALYFDAATTNTELQVFAKGFAALLITDLTANDQLDVVERERLEDVLSELKLGESKFANSSTFAKVGKLLGAEYLIVGSIVSFGPKMRIVSRTVLAETGQEAGSASVFVEENDVFAAEQELVKQLSAGLTRHGVITGSFEPAPKSHPLPLKTAKLYARALDAKDKKHPAEAKKLLTQVVMEQPQFKLAQLDLVNLTK